MHKKNIDYPPVSQENHHNAFFSTFKINTDYLNILMQRNFLLFSALHIFELIDSLFPFSFAINNYKRNPLFIRILKLLRKLFSIRVNLKTLPPSSKPSAYSKRISHSSLKLYYQIIRNGLFSCLLNRENLTKNPTNSDTTSNSAIFISLWINITS